MCRRERKGIFLIQLKNVSKFYYSKGMIASGFSRVNLRFDVGEFVVITGESGSGKTTLLNVISGLDSYEEGELYIEGKETSHYLASDFEAYRKKYIGNIFQNFNLVNSYTVYQNVELILRVNGCKKAEIKRKVPAILKRVGLSKYAKTKVSKLSGGQKQRVAIARDKLVVLVTHEENLAKFYASRIIRIRDGKLVSDENNEHGDHLDYRMENKIYLKDIRDHKRLKTDLYQIDLYNESGDPAALNIVVRGGNIYIQTKSEGDRVEIVDEHSSMELIDDHYRELTKEEALKNSINREKLQAAGRRRYASIISPVSMITKGFKTVFRYPALKKILLLGFLISAMFITYAVSNIFGVLNLTDDEFVTADKSYLTIEDPNVRVKDYLNYERNGDFEYLIPGDGSVSLIMPYRDYYQLQEYSAVFTGSLSDSAKLRDSDLAWGRLPDNKREVAIDKMVLKKAVEDQSTKMAGFASARDFLGETVTVPNMPDMKIVGITDKTSPCIYADRGIFINLLANVPEDPEMASVPGFLFMAYILDKLSGYTIFSNLFLINGKVIGLCLLLLYGFNLVFGLLPVFRTMRKRPAAILSRTDIN